MATNVIIETELTRLFKSNNVNLYHIVPAGAKKPYVTYDRISTSLSTFPGFNDVNFAFNIYGSDIETVNSILSTMEQLFEDALASNDILAVAEITNVVDHTIDNSGVVYVVSARLLYRRQRA